MSSKNLQSLHFVLLFSYCLVASLPVSSLIIEDTFKICPKSLCSIVKKIDIPEYTDICTKDLFFTYNNNTKRGYLSSTGKLLEKSKKVPCENKKKHYSFTFNNITFTIFQQNSTISIEYAKSGKANIKINSNMEEIIIFVKKNFLLCFFCLILLAFIIIIFKSNLLKNRKKFFNCILKVLKLKKREEYKQTKEPVVNAEQNPPPSYAFHLVDQESESSMPALPTAPVFPVLRQTIENIPDRISPIRTTPAFMAPAYILSSNLATAQPQPVLSFPAAETIQAFTTSAQPPPDLSVPADPQPSNLATAKALAVFSTQTETKPSLATPSVPSFSFPTQMIPGITIQVHAANPVPTSIQRYFPKVKAQSAQTSATERGVLCPNPACPQPERRWVRLDRHLLSCMDNYPPHQP
jgi:hypothetical protein